MCMEAVNDKGPIFTGGVLARRWKYCQISSAVLAD